MEIRLLDFAPAGAFEWFWPSRNIENFERSWCGHVAVDRVAFEFRHALGHRHVYGRSRAHGVTWLTGVPMVEGVEADDYGSSRALLSLLKRPDRQHARTDADVPSHYDGFLIVDHRRELSAPRSPRSLAVKIAEDNVAAWATHAAVRAALLSRLPRLQKQNRPPGQAVIGEVLPENTQVDRNKIVEALLAYGRRQDRPFSEAKFAPTPDPTANDFVTQNPLAFLFAVIADQGITAERAWRVPYDLRRRLGQFDLNYIVSNPVAIENAVKGPPALHRFPQKYARWIVAAAERVLDQYGGDAGRIWNGNLTARQVHERLDVFRGIGQKKAAMAVEILERDLRVPISEMQGSDVAYDVHVRRVFLRTGLAKRDDLDHIVAVARMLRPERPGELDQPAWLIGRQWCHAGTPDCAGCPLTIVCPKVIYRIPLSGYSAS
jgi:uncharacterized HhH-GPD family protein